MKQKVVSDNSSELKRTQKLEIKPHQKDDSRIIVAGLAHDFKNILGIIQGYLELMMMEDIPAENQEKIEPIINAGTIGAEILNKLIAVCRADSSQQMEIKSMIKPDVLRNMLATILGSVERLMLDETTSNNQETFGIILDACSRGVKILSQLLAFSKSDSPESHKQLNLNSLLQESMKLFTSGEYSSIKQQWQLEPNLKLVQGDETLLSRVIINIVKNAGQSMEETDLKEWHLKTENMHLNKNLFVDSTELKPGAYAVFTLSDTGCGIKPENLENIFIPYYSTKGSKGTGLGMHVAKEVIEQQHHGAITVGSEVDKGTTIKIYLPGTAF